MNLSYFSEFVTLAETLNFSKAAELSCVSQPALSNHIKALEEELGVVLFERSKRKVEITQEGKMLLTDAQEILEMFDNMHRFTKKKLIENQVFTIGGFLENPDILGRLAFCIQDFAVKNNSQIRLLCDYSSIGDLTKKLLRGKVNFIVAYSNTFDTEAYPTISSVPFYKDPFFVTLNCEHPLSQRESVTLSELKNMTFIRLASVPFQSGWNQVSDACKRQGFSPKYHSVFVDSTMECPFIDIESNECFVIAYGGFSNGLAFNARTDLKLVPVVDEHFSVSLFYNKDESHPLVEDFLKYVSGIEP